MKKLKLKLKNVDYDCIDSFILSKLRESYSKALNSQILEKITSHRWWFCEGAKKITKSNIEMLEKIISHRMKKEKCNETMD